MNKQGYNMNTIEFFAGSQSFSKVAKERGHNVFTTDINEKLPGIDYYCDIMDFDPKNIPFIPDVVWASPDCATWSLTSGNTHYDSGSTNPKTEKAILAKKHIDKTLEIIKLFLDVNPNLLYYIENPVGRLKHYIASNQILAVPFFHRLSQCQYGNEFKKPTDIFSNDGAFIPKLCRDKNHHERNIKKCRWAKRHSYPTNGYYWRAKVPEKLCEEILISAESQTSSKKVE